MDRVCQEIRELLDQSPAGALPLSRLVEELNRGGVRPPNGQEGIVRAAEGERNLFRLLHPWRGPWSHTPHPGRGGRSDQPNTGLPEETWVLGRGKALSSWRGRGWAASRLQETLQAWGEALDVEAPASVARWIRAAREAEEAWRILLRAG